MGLVPEVSLVLFRESWLMFKLKIDVINYIRWMVTLYCHDAPQNRMFAGPFISNNIVMLNIEDKLDSTS